MAMTGMQVDSRSYRVEEPPLNDQNQNKLKRKYSQLSKINIEEMKPSEWSRDEAAVKASFYLVDQSSDGPDSHDLAYLGCSRVPGRTSGGRMTITEIVDDSYLIFDENKKPEREDEEKMEF